MKQFLIVVVILAFSCPTAFAQDSEASDETVTLTGYLFDKKCADDNAEKLDEAAATHPASCARSCIKEGSTLGLVADGKWYALDKPSRKKATKVLNDARQDRSARVEVSGKVNGDKLKIDSIKEIEASE